MMAHQTNGGGGGGRAEAPDSNEPMHEEAQEEMESLALHDDVPSSSSSSTVDQRSANSPFNSFLEPPSYAEAVFTSFDATSSNGHDSPKSPFSSSEYLSITVSDPQKELEQATSLVPGAASYYTYLITTRTNLPEYGVSGSGSQFEVRRRFRDVVTLADRLSESFRGYFIPLRPDKNVVESQVMQKQDFIEQRRIELERYLRKLAVHPVIKRSEELRAFLVVKGKLPLPKSVDVASRMLDGAVRLPRQLLGEESPVSVREVVQPARGGRDLLRIFRELKQSVANDWGGVKPLVVEEDKEFLERKGKIMGFEQQLTNVSQQAESLVKSQQDIGETMGELGLAFVKLTKLETDEAVFESQRARATDMKNFATVAVKASRLYRELNSQTVKHLEKLHEYLGIMLSINNAFSDRSSSLLTVQTLTTELASLHSRIEKLEAASSKIFGGDRSRLRKIEELKENVRVTEDAKNCAVREYERIKENNRSELERLNKEMHNDFMTMLKGFVANQAGYAEKMAVVWDKVAEETSVYADGGN